MRLRPPCAGECNIRVDLPHPPPMLLLLPAAARAAAPRARAA
jgi:hypothetical protein